MIEKKKSERFERGLKTRREVLGAEYVDRSLEQADAILVGNAGAYDGVVLGRHVNRPGLDRRSAQF